jgi:hypothetical protein
VVKGLRAFADHDRQIVAAKPGHSCDCTYVSDRALNLLGTLHHLQFVRATLSIIFHNLCLQG